MRFETASLSELGNTGHGISTIPGPTSSMTGDESGSSREVVSLCGGSKRMEHDLV